MGMTNTLFRQRSK